MIKVGFISLGCAKNQVDCERMMYRVQEAGFEVCADVVDTDVVVINTCGFIDSAKSEAIDSILQMAQLKEQGLVGKILVTGCLSQRYQQEIITEIPEVDAVIGTTAIDKIADAIDEVLNGKRAECYRVSEKEDKSVRRRTGQRNPYCNSGKERESVLSG